MKRVLKVLAIFLAGIAGAVVIAVFLASLWSTNYAVAYYANFRSGAVYNAYSHGDWLMPIRQARLYASDPRIHHTTVVAWFALVAELTAFAILALILIFQPFKIKPPAGGARMATRADLRKAGLLNGVRGKSILLGRIGKQDVRYSGDGHFFVNGPTRTGKGRGFVMTNLLEWKGSAIVLDVKQENWRLTGPARMAMGQRVFLFAPGSVESHRWNPLDFIRPWPARATDLTNLSKAIVPLPSKETQTIWKETAQGLFASVLGYVLDSKTMEGRRHLRSALRMFTGEAKFSDVLRRILKEEPDLNAFVRDGFRLHLAREEEQQLSFEGNIVTPMSPWKNALIAAATSDSDFDIRELRSDPFSIFIGVPVGDFGTAEPIIRLLIQQIHDIMLARIPDPVKEPHRVLLMLDEFYQFEQLPEIVKRAPLMAGFGLIIVAIAQGITQIDDRYTAVTRKAFLGNMDVRLYIAVGDIETAEIVSKEVGYHYVERESWSRQQGGRSSLSGRFEFVPLKTVAQIMGLSDKKTLLYIRSVATAELTKLNFYTDTDFVTHRRAIGALKKKLPEPRVDLLLEWPLFTERPEREELHLPQQAAVGSRADAVPALGPEHMAAEGLSGAVVNQARAVYRRPEKFFDHARRALEAPEHDLVVTLLKTLRTDPAQYGEFAMTPPRGLFRKLASPGSGTREIQALRDTVVSARRAVIADRARLDVRSQVAVPTGDASPTPASTGIHDVVEMPARAIEPQSIGPAAIAAEISPPVSEDDDVGGTPRLVTHGSPSLRMALQVAGDDEETVDIREIAGSIEELSTMERIVDSIDASEASGTDETSAERVARIRGSIASVRRLIEQGLSDEPQTGALEGAPV